MKERIIKTRLVILILSFIGIISIMSISIKGEVDKIDSSTESYKEKLIRFHVIANSDSDEDQELKLKVRDEIISYLQPKLGNSKSIEESENIIINEYENLHKIGKETIEANGYSYDVKVGIEYSNFPTKQYSNVILPAGEYKALKVVIGNGTGKNWWCVLYPPLCFIDISHGTVNPESEELLKETLTTDEFQAVSDEYTVPGMNSVIVEHTPSRALSSLAT